VIFLSKLYRLIVFVEAASDAWSLAKYFLVSAPRPPMISAARELLD
jgi:hypothetical protein